MYHVWDNEKKEYCKLASNAYAKLGSVYTTYSGVLHAVAYKAQWPEEMNNEVLDKISMVRGWFASPEYKEWRAKRDAWWKANKHRPWEEIINPRYELHKM